MQSRHSKKAPCFIHTHLDIKVSISEVNMELPQSCLALDTLSCFP